jgi:hypothetical protein
LWARSSPIPVVVSTLLRSTLRAYIV